MPEEKERDVVINSIEQGYNWLAGEKARIKKEFKKDLSDGKIQISSATPEDRIKYLKHAISLIKADKFPDEVNYLKARIMGYSNQEISQSSGASLMIVEVLGREAMKRAQDAIYKARKSGIPLLGGN